MDIKKLAKKPELIEIVIDDETIVKDYGESITFWMKDQVDINTYFDFFRSQNEKDGGELGQVLAKLILTKDGKPVLGEGETLPIDITVLALTKINETLGKSTARSSTQKVGTQQK
jgi:hypothetical protein